MDGVAAVVRAIILTAGRLTPVRPLTAMMCTS